MEELDPILQKLKLKNPYVMPNIDEFKRFQENVRSNVVLQGYPSVSLKDFTKLMDLQNHGQCSVNDISYHINILAATLGGESRFEQAVEIVQDNPSNYLALKTLLKLSKKNSVKVLFDPKDHQKLFDAL